MRDVFDFHGGEADAVHDEGRKTWTRCLGYEVLCRLGFRPSW